MTASADTATNSRGTRRCPTDGGSVVQYDDWNGNNQQWQLIHVG